MLTYCGASNDNLHFDDQSKQVNFLFSVELYSELNRKQFLRVSMSYRSNGESLVKAMATIIYLLVFPQHFSFSETAYPCFY